MPTLSAYHSTMDLKSLFQDISQAAEVLGHGAAFRRAQHESWLDDPVKAADSHTDWPGPWRVDDGVAASREIWRLLYLAALVAAGSSRTASEVRAIIEDARCGVKSVIVAARAADAVFYRMRRARADWQFAMAGIPRREPPLPMPPRPEQLSRPACEDLCQMYVAAYGGGGAARRTCQGRLCHRRQARRQARRQTLR